MGVLFICLFLSRGLSLGTLVFVLGKRCGGGPCPPGDQRSSRWDPQLPPRRTAQGRPIPEHKCSSEPPRASHGSGEVSGPAERLPGPATASWLPWPRSSCGTDPSQPRARTSNGHSLRARSFKLSAGAAPDLARKPRGRALVPARWRRGRAGAGGQWRPLAGNALGASPFFHSQRMNGLVGSSGMFESKLWPNSAMSIRPWYSVPRPVIS